jgi:hypothetical protein
MDHLQREKACIRQAILEKFGTGTVMVCKKINLQAAHSIWYAQISCLKATQDQLIACVVPLEEYFEIESSAPLEDLQWISFQTRQSTDQALLAGLPMQPCPLKPEMTDVSREVLLGARFKCVSTNQTSFTYLCDKMPSLRMDLLLDKSTSDYRREGTLSQCLDTFQCVLGFQL